MAEGNSEGQKTSSIVENPNPFNAARTEQRSVIDNALNRSDTGKSIIKNLNYINDRGRTDEIRVHSVHTLAKLAKTSGINPFQIAFDYAATAQTGTELQSMVASIATLGENSAYDGDLEGYLDRFNNTPAGVPDNIKTKMDQMAIDWEQERNIGAIYEKYIYSQDYRANKEHKSDALSTIFFTVANGNEDFPASLREAIIKNLHNSNLASFGRAGLIQSAYNSEVDFWKQVDINVVNPKSAYRNGEQNTKMNEMLASQNSARDVLQQIVNGGEVE